MRKLYHDFLFAKGLFVGSGGVEQHAAETLAALAKLFNIKVVKHPEWAHPAMIEVASRNLGRDVPEPFYRGFPESVCSLSIDEQLLDRVLHYAMTYGLGDFSQPGHSLFEEELERACFDETVETREFAIIDEADAITRLAGAVDALMTSTRPLNDAHYELVLAYVKDFGYKIAACNCKDTAVRLLLDTRDEALATFLKLSDIIRLVEQLQFQAYDSKNMKKLNLRNRDRVFLSKVLDRIFREGTCDARACFEKRQLWKGLLHHLHYKPVNEKAAQFLVDVRGTFERSSYSAFERALHAGDVRGAVDVLLADKGSTAVLRNLDYLLSRCQTQEEADYVLSRLQADNKIALIQLLLHYGGYRASDQRVFTFSKFNMTCVHEETEAEAARRRSVVPKYLVERAREAIHAQLEAVCKGTLGRVYVDEGMKRIALPLQLGTSMGGVATLARGTRIPLPEGKKLRAFTYWELVNDIDLSVFSMSEDGRRLNEFSWRTLSDTANSTGAIVYSGDQTSGYHGGSEYFDVDFAAFRKAFPRARYIVFCNNVYSRARFSDCFCTAGYMMRDERDSGEVFEPKTVESSFAITCPSSFAYLFAIDLAANEFVWLNMARTGSTHVAGVTGMEFLLDYMHVTDVINLYDFASMLATEVVDDPHLADVVFSDNPAFARANAEDGAVAGGVRESAELVRSCDTERIIELMN